MAVPEHTLFSFRGHLGNTVADLRETWSIGIRMLAEDNPTGGGGVYPQTSVEQAAAAMRTFITTATNRFITQVWFDEVRVYLVGTDGKMKFEPRRAGPTSATQGPVATGVHPWQCSNVVSLYANGIGKGKRGRVYLPPQSHVITPDGTIGAADVTQTLSGFTTFLNALNALPHGGAVSTVASVIGNTGSIGTGRPVRHIRMGTVMDTQRRRRRSLAEAYVEQVGAAAPAYGEYELAGPPISTAPPPP